MDGQHLNLRLGLGIGVAIALLLLIWLIKLLLPWFLLLSGVAALGYGWHHHQQFQQRLYRCFYVCLEQNQGKVRALDFAIAAHITGPQARAFLDARAKDFFADFEPTDYGDVVYTFRTQAPMTMPRQSLLG
jgi:hypothetical protein